MIFLLLYSTFGSFKDALMVVLNVPFAAIGGLLSLHIAGETLSISAGIGFLSLFGIAIQDGVILISYINRLSQSGADDLHEAVVEGASLRLRPVVMTAMLAGLGLLPAALSHGIGSEAQRPLALVIVGGMVTTTLLTLLVLPVVFAWVNRRRNGGGNGGVTAATTAIMVATMAAPSLPRWRGCERLMAAVPEAWRYLRSRSAGATIGLMILPAPAPGARACRKNEDERNQDDAGTPGRGHAGLLSRAGPGAGGGFGQVRRRRAEAGKPAKSDNRNSVLPGNARR